jgi:hypothetical protein
MNKLYEALKVDMALAPQAINNTAVVGSYYSLKDCMRAIFILNCAVLATSKTSILSVNEATDSSGTSAQALTSASATITAHTLNKAASADISSIANTDTITVTAAGTAYTFTKAAALDASAREFNTAANLVTCITDATYGVPNCTAAAATNVVTVTALDGLASVTLSKVENAGTIVLAGVSAVCYVEVENMSLSSGFTHIAPVVTVNDTSGNSLNSVVLLRELKKLPTQYVGASAAV